MLYSLVDCVILDYETKKGLIRFLGGKNYERNKSVVRGNVIGGFICYFFKQCKCYNQE